MSAVALRLHSELRRRWRAWIGLALLIGLGGGIAMALLQGARQTRDAYPRFANGQRAADVVVTGANQFGFVGGVDLDRVAALPEVRRTARAFAAVPFSGRLQDGRAINHSDLLPVVATDRQL